MAFIPTITILAALKTRLAALELEPGMPLFEKVEYYTSSNLVQALEELRLFKNRICLIVPGGAGFENEVSGRSMTSDVERTVHLLMTDRDYGRRQDASTGDADRPGVLKMCDLVVNDLTGRNLGIRNCLVMPVEATPVTLVDKDRLNAAGREAYNLELAVECGQLLTQH